ncbi:MAG: DUF4242 domain-containing protein [Frankiaceae bacterium]|nr:DUF4242 domain-containing protein [Frankiaceae bacterium]
MPRYLVERTFPDGLEIPMDEGGAKTCLDVVRNNAEEQVTWVTSYVSADRTRTYCVYDGPTTESIVRAAQANGLPVDTVTECSVLDPYFYRSLAGAR